MFYLNVTPLVRLPRSVGQIFTYSHNESLNTGSLVLVYFRGKRVLGVVRDVTLNKPDFKISPIIHSLPYKLTDCQESLAELLRSNYGATDTLAYLTIVPNLRRTNTAIQSKFTLNKALDRSVKKVTLWNKYPDPTSSYVKKFITDNLKSGSVLMLVPDHISLVKVKTFYPNAYTWDTSTSSKSTDSWNNINNDFKLIIGTRHSIFAPFNNLSAVVIIDAPSELYRSRDAQPKYNAVDLVNYLQAKFSFNLLNVQSIPTITESAGSYLAKQNTTQAELTLLERRGYHFSEKKETLASEIIKDITEAKGITMIYANKKGYGALFCSECEYIHRCPNCDIALITEGFVSTALHCYKCKQEFEVPNNCPSCHQQTLKHFGQGIRKIREYLQLQIPNKPIIEIDASQTKNHDVFINTINLLPSNSVILATAAVLPRLWILPNIDLIVIPRADQHLLVDNWRANEDFMTMIKSFITLANKLVVEMSSLDYEIMGHIKTDTIENFVNHEKQDRLKNGYPPFQNIISLTGLTNTQDLMQDIPKENIVIVKNNEIIFKTNNTSSLKNIWDKLPDTAKIDINTYSLG